MPTLRPLYKWLVQEYTRLTSKGKESKTSTREWMRLKKSSTTSPKKDNGSHATSGTKEEDKLPIQKLVGYSGSSIVELEVPKQGHKSEANSAPNFKSGLHLHGDWSFQAMELGSKDRQWTCTRGNRASNVQTKYFAKGLTGE